MRTSSQFTWEKWCDVANIKDEFLLKCFKHNLINEAEKDQVKVNCDRYSRCIAFSKVVHTKDRKVRENIHAIMSDEIHGLSLEDRNKLMPTIFERITELCPPNAQRSTVLQTVITDRHLHLISITLSSTAGAYAQRDVIYGALGLRECDREQLSQRASACGNPSYSFFSFCMGKYINKHPGVTLGDLTELLHSVSPETMCNQLRL